jgi:hypothetical protein
LRALLDHLREQVAEDQYDGRAEKPREKIPELGETGLESVGEVQKITL